jgi:hypothetical protein
MHNSQNIKTSLKQGFLKDKIPETQRDEFVAFLENQKVGSLDIENWSYNELIRLVMEFKKKRNHLNKSPVSIQRSELRTAPGFWSKPVQYYEITTTHKQVDP